MSSSPYPVLDNRPIDKWKVTELKEELKRRRLTTRGLKEELVRRLDDALRAEQEDATRAAAEEAHQKSEQEDAALAAAEEAHQKSEQEDATLAAAEEAHQKSEQEDATLAAAEEAYQKAELTPLTGGDVIPDQKQTTPVEAALSTETTPAAAETAPEPTEAKTTTAVKRIPPSVFLKPEVNDDKVDVKPHEVDMNDGVESGLTASEQNIHKSENKKPFSGLDDGDSKAQQTDAVLEKSATNDQVPEVIPVIGFEVKSDCISTDSVTNNEKIELKDNEIAANVKLEQNVNKSQEPSTVVAESHPMDVEEPLEQKISAGDGDSDAANADMTIENNIIHAGDSEKLNLDRSSGDESMDDELETKQTESITSSEVVNNSEKSEMLTDKGKTHADNMDTGKSEPPENNIHTLVASDKRKLPVNAVGNNEFAKRQRRWNSESVKIPEARATDATNNTIPITTPRSTGLKRDFSRSDSSVSEDGPKERVVPPSLKEPTNSLRIDRFLRPFTLKAVQELLGKTGNVTSFWMDHIKTHCYVSYSSAEEAVATREAVYNLQWPPNGGHLLIAEFVGPEEVKAKLEPPLPPLPQSQSQSPSRPPPTALPPPPPLAKSPPFIEQLPLLPPPPPPLVPEEQEPPIVTLDDLFKKTKAIPRIYYLPLSEEQVAAKLAAKNK